ncbi:zf-TFIIB domain-containing protein [Actinomadura barringtoniae]|uniref:Zf-TFIIB domain-containing protein n=1 Tax=Actinomadura barringtoniae TaxID=1427535 RepID=A0A939PH84_9ACTN|nr:zf-TFIIB domain-containing protein [Actinomadura barringtoniae]MBO2452222.1 zf-TFIIB domain-containing protein [Actinomadura barringtoniae]
MHCPKCRAEMVGYQRDGILIEQCTACRAVLIGEYELVKLVETCGCSLPPPLPSNGHGGRAYEGRHRRF